MNRKDSLYETATELIKVLILTVKNEKDEDVLIEVDEDETVEGLEKIIKEAITFIEPRDVKKLTDKTKDIIEEFKENGQEPEMTLLEEIESIESFKALKEIALSEPQFKSIRGKLASFHNIDKLREEMVWLFTGSKVPDKPTEEQELPLDETQEEVAEKLHKKLEEKPVNAKFKGKVEAAKEPTEEEMKTISLDEESYQGLLIMQCSEIKMKKPFNSIFGINEKTLESVIKNMEQKGYDNAFPIILWNDVVIDGHTRLEAAEALGMKEVPVWQKEFKNEQEALEYAVHNQRDRRNLSDAELLRCIAVLDKPMTKKEAGQKGGLSSSETKTRTEKTHEKTAKTLGVGKSKVSDARTVLKDEEAKKEVETGKKTISAAAKEVREKKSIGKPKKTKVAKKTRIDAVCQVVKDYEGSELSIQNIISEADVVFEEDFKGVSNMKETEKAVEAVLEVLKAMGWIEFLSDDMVQIGKGK